MRLLALIVLGLLASIQVTGEVVAAPVTYALSPVLDDGQIKALAVTVTFRATASGETHLALPSGYGAGAAEGWCNVRQMEIDGATSVDSPSSSSRILHSAPNAPLTVRYQIVPADDRDPNIADADRYEPVIRPTYFYALGQAVFAEPYDKDDASARFVWSDPGKIPFASDLQVFGPHATLADIQRSTLAGGPDLNVAKSGVVTVAAIGRYGFSPQEAADLASSIRRAELAFWGDPETPFVVTIGPVFSQSPLSKLVSGNGRISGFAIRLSPTVDAGELAFLFAHENFHTWNPTLLGGGGPDSGVDLWFSEGFTDYYARTLLLRSGLISPEQFTDLWNDELAAYAASPARLLPNIEAAAGFWTDAAKERIPYQRGAFLAAIWDERLREQSHNRFSLDDVMRAQRRQVLSGDKTPAAALFVKVAAQFGLDVRDDIDRYIVRGEPIDLPAGAFGPCFDVSRRNQPVYERGWDVHGTTLAGDHVAGLRDDSAAYRAGLRNGMKLTRRRGDSQHDSSQPLEFWAVDAQGEERAFEFKPEGNSSLSVQHLSVNNNGSCATAAPAPTPS